MQYVLLGIQVVERQGLMEEYYGRKATKMSTDDVEVCSINDCDILLQYNGVCGTE